MLNNEDFLCCQLGVELNGSLPTRDIQWLCDLKSLTLSFLQSLQSLLAKKYQAKQLFKWITLNGPKGLQLHSKTEEKKILFNNTGWDGRREMVDFKKAA